MLNVYIVAPHHFQADQPPFYSKYAGENLVQNNSVLQSLAGVGLRNLGNTGCSYSTADRRPTTQSPAPELRVLVHYSTSDLWHADQDLWTEPIQRQGYKLIWCTFERGYTCNVFVTFTCQSQDLKWPVSVCLVPGHWEIPASNGVMILCGPSNQARCLSNVSRMSIERKNVLRPIQG